jgi:sugar phosphate isomerase/epimerase
MPGRQRLVERGNRQTMKRLPLAVATRCLGRPFKSALLLAAQLRANGVQLDTRNELKPDELSATGRRELLHRLEELGISIAALDFPVRRGLLDDERLDARIAALKQTMDFASLLRCRVVTVRLGRLPGEHEPLRDVPLAVLSELAGHGNRVGVTLALGPGGESPAALHELLRQVSAGPLGVNFDPLSAIAAGGVPVDAVCDWGSYLAHVIVRDATREGEGAVTEVPIGRGEVAWQELLAVTHELDYRGWYCVERTQGDDRAGDAGRAIEYIRALELG